MGRGLTVGAELLRGWVDLSRLTASQRLMASFLLAGCGNINPVDPVKLV